ncbi:MAG TPA: PadR family transcriptional regulator [Gemmatimonadales bacterium]|nr:PadR family transcriptional regulator [Gemmatimonadales bacterium]
MSEFRFDWGLGEFFGAGFGPGGFAFGCGERTGRHGRRRSQMFESGETKFVILRLLREKPRHGYEIIKAIEERMGGWYTPSAGTVYPTLQLLEDQGYVRGAETEGRRVYHITPEGERFLDENRDLLEEIFDRVRATVRGYAGGSMGELNAAFGRLTASVYRGGLASGARAPLHPPGRPDPARRGGPGGTRMGRDQPDMMV